MKPYELSQLVTNIVLLAQYLLHPGGHLVFFLPMGMELIANSLQDFESWGQRLITIKKTAHAEYLPLSFDYIREVEESRDTHILVHKDFREKYFQGFKRDDER
ncbi:uncharacterized protein F5891DRAFT_1234460 [Suillus fuscotomentosus]|uniref:Uncharacterized protein n=1 Tax=Suillus fuscotomentosus TaxID=1912939 RepID=A0AAD4E664_9AGAM|nr:uncharacterized protein F5891DRAFT_1234460 [Suillus fuscotomentosus]KAG1899164.1 hypothetical protein F5891DRAFT_1234460 [Suillus fuscotomentosus]